MLYVRTVIHTKDECIHKGQGLSLGSKIRMYFLFSNIFFLQVFENEHTLIL